MLNCGKSGSSSEREQDGTESQSETFNVQIVVWHLSQVRRDGVTSDVGYQYDAGQAGGDRRSYSYRPDKKQKMNFICDLQHAAGYYTCLVVNVAEINRLSIYVPPRFPRHQHHRVVMDQRLNIMYFGKDIFITKEWPMELFSNRPVLCNHYSTVL